MYPHLTLKNSVADENCEQKYKNNEESAYMPGQLRSIKRYAEQEAGGTGPRGRAKNETEKIIGHSNLQLQKATSNLPEPPK